jgi:hypothetical protein
MAGGHPHDGFPRLESRGERSGPVPRCVRGREPRAPAAPQALGKNGMGGVRLCREGRGVFDRGWAPGWGQAGGCRADAGRSPREGMTSLATFAPRTARDPCKRGGLG